MKKFEQIIGLCKKEFGDRVLYSSIEQREYGPTLFISIDASHEKEDNAFYPSFENGELKIWESWSNTLHLYIYEENHARYYYQGWMTTGPDGRRYSEPFDNDGREIIDETVFSLDVYTPEEAVEWFRFIYKFRDGSINAENKFLQTDELNASHWFQEPRVFLPEFSDKLVPLSTASKHVNVFDLPKMYDKAFHLGGQDWDGFDFSSEKFLSEITAMNQEGQAELQAFGEKFKDCAEGFDDTIQPGDFLVAIGRNAVAYTWKTYDAQQNQFSNDHLLVLRPTPGNSYTAIHDFLFRQPEGKSFLQKVASDSEAWSNKIRFIPDCEAQQQYIIRKKTGFDALRSMVYQMSKKYMNPDECVRMVEEANGLLKRYVNS